MCCWWPTKLIYLLICDLGEQLVFSCLSLPFAPTQAVPFYNQKFLHNYPLAIQSHVGEKHLSPDCHPYFTTVHLWWKFWHTCDNWNRWVLFIYIINACSSVSDIAWWDKLMLKIWFKANSSHIIKSLLYCIETAIPNRGFSVCWFYFLACITDHHFYVCWFYFLAGCHDSHSGSLYKNKPVQVE